MHHRLKRLDSSAAGNGIDSAGGGNLVDENVIEAHSGIGNLSTSQSLPRVITYPSELRPSAIAASAPPRIHARPPQDPYPMTTPPLKSRLPTHRDADDVLLPNPGIRIKVARENFWCEFRSDEQLRLDPAIHGVDSLA
jgi:hypothetical protein